MDVGSRMRNRPFRIALSVGCVTQTVFLITLTAAYGQTPASTAAAVGAVAPTPASPACNMYSDVNPRPYLQAAFPPACGTVLPELFGLRRMLAQDGFGFSLAFNGPADITYDLLGHDAKPQQYGGQIPTYTTKTVATVSYDLARVGFSKAAQLDFQVSLSTSSYTNFVPHSLSISEFAIDQPLLDNVVELRYGYIPLIENFYGIVLGGNAAGAATGANSLIPIEVGLGLSAPTPAFEVILRDPANKKIYNNFAATRSTAPGPLQLDADENPSGLRFSLPNAGPLLVDEFGYGSSRAPLWVRIGGLYNMSHYRDYKTGGLSEDNYVAYAAITDELYAQDRLGHGLYIDVKMDYAPEAQNLFARDYAITLFDRGPFGRLHDTVAVGVGQSFFGRDIRRVFAAHGNYDPPNTFGTNISYVYNVIRGIFLSGNISYTTNPATVFKREPNALIGSFGVQLFF